MDEYLPMVAITKGNAIQSINLWHIVDGEWRHIVQCYDGEDTDFFTDGKLEECASTDNAAT